ncbi:MAG TPA: hypothetical protein VMT25_06835, partial [Thermoanaerobaculia bacterium]|nr:hypothetical protein [Thermoanaerobaculia bacterium]
MSTAKQRENHLAPAIGASIGLLIGHAVARGLHVAPAAGQLPGFALDNGFDPRRDVFRLAILLAGSLLGGVVARIAWRGRSRGVRESAQLSLSPRAPLARPAAAAPGLVGPAVVAHAIAIWSLVAAALVPRGVWPPVIFAAAAGLSFSLAMVLGRGSAAAGAPYLGAASPILALGFLGTTTVPRVIAGTVAGFLLPVLARLAAGR